MIPMQSVLKILAAIFLGLGILALESRAASVMPGKPGLAFLGLGVDSDPLFGKELARRIRWELGADTALFAFPASETNALYSRGVLDGFEAGPLDIKTLTLTPGAEFYAFGHLEPLTITGSRKWYMPWSVKIRWSQALRLRVIQGATGKTVYDEVLPAEIAEKGWFTTPDAPNSRMSPLDRDALYRRMLPLLSVEGAKALAQVASGKKSESGKPSEKKP